LHSSAIPFHYIHIIPAATTTTTTTTTTLQFLSPPNADDHAPTMTLLTYLLTCTLTDS
jgi:hypothetical protein